MNCDEDLARQLAGGSHEAMERLIDDYGERLRRLIGQLTAWGPDVDDLLQETLLRIWRRSSTYRGEAAFEKWLVSIAFRVCQDHRRSTGRMLRHLHNFWKTSTNEKHRTAETLQDATESGRWQRIQQALQRLSASDRELLVMTHIEHWSHTELAAHLGVSMKTLHVRLHRARQRLKQQIEP